MVRKIEALKTMDQSNKATDYVKDLLHSKESGLKQEDRIIILKKAQELKTKKAK
jgi:hypothetical protein